MKQLKTKTEDQRNGRNPNSPNTYAKQVYNTRKSGDKARSKPQKI